MDLTILIKDENCDTLEKIIIYQDGSDAEGTARIKTWLASEFSIDGDETD